MGIQLELYRAVIGTFLSRVRQRRTRARKAENSDSWKPPTELSSGHCESRARVSVPQGKSRVLLLVVALHLSAYTVCMLKPTCDRNLHDLSQQMLLAGDISENPGPVYDFNYVYQPNGAIPDWSAETAIRGELAALRDHLTYVQNTAAWSLDYAHKLWVSMQENEREWKAYCFQLQSQVNTLHYENAALKQRVDYLAWEMQTSRASTEAGSQVPFSGKRSVAQADVRPENNGLPSGQLRDGTYHRKRNRNHRPNRRRAVRVRTLVSVPVSSDCAHGSRGDMSLDPGVTQTPGSRSLRQATCGPRIPPPADKLQFSETLPPDPPPPPTQADDDRLGPPVDHSSPRQHATRPKGSGNKSQSSMLEFVTTSGNRASEQERGGKHKRPPCLGEGGDCEDLEQSVESACVDATMEFGGTPDVQSGTGVWHGRLRQTAEAQVCRGPVSGSGDPT